MAEDVMRNVRCRRDTRQRAGDARRCRDAARVGGGPVNDWSRYQTAALSLQSFNSVSHETAKCPMPKPKYK